MEHTVPVLAAELSESELSTWIPIPFQEINDPESAPEPTKGALVKLEAGPYVVLFYGKDSGQLVLRLPISQKASANLRHFFHEVPIPLSRIVWHRADVELPAAASTQARDQRTKKFVRLRTSVKVTSGSGTSKNSRNRPSASRSAKKR
jgi:hypothetical protein